MFFAKQFDSPELITERTFIPLQKISFPKIHSIPQLYQVLPEEERLMVDILRQLIRENLPPYCKEKIAYNVPFFYGKKGICIIWPATIPKGGFKEGVLLGFWQGNKLKDEDGYLKKGTNKKVFYRIYKKAEEIDTEAIVKLLKESLTVENSAFKTEKK